jgi:hypothetical protein
MDYKVFRERDAGLKQPVGWVDFRSNPGQLRVIVGDKKAAKKLSGNLQMIAVKRLNRQFVDGGQCYGLIGGPAYVTGTRM